MHPEIKEGLPGECPKCGMKLIEKGKNQSSPQKDKDHKSGSGLYTCPMDPEIIQDKPGKCPKCGMGLVPLHSEGHNGHGGHASMEHDFRRRFFITLPFVILSMLLSSMIQLWMGFEFNFPGREFILFLIGAFIFVYGGIPFFKAAKGELGARNPAMMTLVAFAITVGFTFSVAATFLFPGESLYWEIATLISVFLLGHWLEMRAVRGATGALAELAKLIPLSAHLLKKGGGTRDVETSTLIIGDLVLVKPGEKIPVDGIVITGESSVNESMITGESRPIDKKKGNKVIGGTLNQDGSLTIKVGKTGADTAISQIMKLIREAQASKPNVQHLADRAAGVLFYVAVIAGITSFIFWMYVVPMGAVFAATIAVAVIVIACPHALGLAIPTVTTITSTLGAKNGVLIKDMKGLEIARKISYVVFDKTGTLTKGEFGVTDVIQSKNSALKIDKLMELTAAVEAHSQHSIAQGIVNKAKKDNLKIPNVEGFKSYPGKGASGIVNKQRITVGNRKLLKELRLEESLEQLDLTRVKGKTSVFVVIDKKPEGVILLADIVREESRQAIKKLHEMGIKTAMLTGDTKDVAEVVGKELNIDTVFAEVLPEDKVNKIKELQNQGNVVAMVGDGVNDAPSLTQAHVGIAIGAGTDVAVESADIVLMKNDPLDVVKAIKLSQETNKKMVQNLIWATGYNVFAIPTAAGVLYPAFGILLRPEWAAILMSASSVIVVINALMLRKTKLA
ncbi:copper-translocating P-type ATPase [Candidatus Roizmanbacteria bacterium RIFCSPHIGHO2_01_FULL_35_10]|uniref:Copper-translocating P-type ATPase n=1 Tax=Candidatus Roizmanbacteria bacterium RIFCSPLOWO2_01_FULL_35_13 TaxID=1802055 RepID=A0A1F7I6P7_9BACT|nr:MAG: copper-translocating P-type ATPase [Candidatus Roizmanbacteria bacterium RIFCSPHIGHO2_01_FULL_35_10]OGK39044.1 MAG: copper-translocating P-type ATPase [Candidatus Roizmanbacteria bacterium RIFCSPLOWO2_01_FULL_35_13]